MLSVPHEVIILASSPQSGRGGGDRGGGMGSKKALPVASIPRECWNVGSLWLGVAVSNLSTTIPYSFYLGKGNTEARTYSAVLSVTKKVWVYSTSGRHNRLKLSCTG